MSTAPSTESAIYQPPSWEAILAAHARISPRIHRTPILTSASLNAMTGAQLFFKCENLQKTGSFKIRGASNAILSLTEKEVAKGIGEGHRHPVERQPWRCRGLCCCVARSAGLDRHAQKCLRRESQGH